MTRLVEIRSYRLVPDTFDAFAGLFRERALPMLSSAGIDVVAFGRNPDDPNSAFLIRSFADLADRTTREDAFYGSAAWRSGPREAILDCIEVYTDTLLRLDEATVDGLRAVGLEGSRGISGLREP